MNTILNIFRKNQPQEIETRESKRTARRERVHSLSDTFRDLAYKLLTEPRVKTDSVGIQQLIDEFALRTVIDMGNPDWRGWFSTDPKGYYYNRIIMLNSEWERQTQVLGTDSRNGKYYTVNNAIIKPEVELLLAHMNDIYCHTLHKMGDWQKGWWQEWQHSAHMAFNRDDGTPRNRMVIDIARLFDPEDYYGTEPSLRKP